MQRTSKHRGEVSAILCSDLHLREDVPICRTDDYISAQWKKMDFIAELQLKHNCPVLCGGDFFDYWKPSPKLLSSAIMSIPADFWSIYGAA